MVPPPTRRLALAALSLTLVAGAAPPGDPAARFIRDLQADFARAAPIGKPADAAAVERVISRAFDMDEIARLALGPRAASATPTQIRRLGGVYLKRVVRETLARRRKARSEAVITGSKPAGPGLWLVTTRAVSTTNDPMMLAWKVRKSGAAFRIVDVLRDGSSLVNSERRRFETALRTRTLDAVIAELEQKYARPRT